MDPATLSNLDPKLRETYERVMGAAAASETKSNPAGTNPPASPNTPSNPETTAQSAIPSPQNPSALPQASSTNDTISAMTTPPVQPAELAALQPTMTGATLPASQSAQPETPLQPLPSPASINQTMRQASGISPVLKILYFTAGIIFFIVYAVFWLVIFNYPLPF